MTVPGTQTEFTRPRYPTITMCTSPGPCTPVTSWYSMSADRLGPVPGASFHSVCQPSGRKQS